MTKVLVFLLMFSILYVLKCIIDLVIAMKQNTKLKREIWENVSLGVAISYIFTIIFTGF